MLWLLPGVASLATFGWLLAQVEAGFAGRAFAAYGGVYIAASFLWMWGAEGQKPDAWYVAGAAICLVGAAVTLAEPAAFEILVKATVIAVGTPAFTAN